MNQELARAIDNELKTCTCNNKKGPFPFYFQINPSKKIVLITWSPTFQAVYRHLVSTRFFRCLCLSLYGPYPNLDVFESIVNRDIYWTHYHKCYVPKSERENISSQCAKKYLKREIKALSPNLVMILGEPVIKRLLGETVRKGEIKRGEYLNTKYIAANFPEQGNELEFIEIRKDLSEFINGIDVSPVSQEMVTRTAKTKGTAAVHVNFELPGLKEYWRQIKQIDYPGDYPNVDDMWYRTHTIPRLLKYSFVIACYSFIEDQLNPLLLEAGVPYDRYISVVERLKRLVRTRQPHMRIEQDLIKDLGSLRDIRNKLVHNDGRLNPGETIKEITGIYTYLNVIEVTAEGCETALDIVQRFVKLIVRLD